MAGKREPRQKEWKASIALYTENFGILEHEVPEQYIMAFAHEMADWSKSDLALKLCDFYDMYDIPGQYIERWKNKYPWFKRAVLLAKSRIGSRREKKGLIRSFDPNMVLQTMALYDEEFREFLKYKAQLRDENESNEPHVIIIKEFADGKRETVSDNKKVDVEKKI